MNQTKMYSQEKVDAFYDALLRRDSSYVGIFYAAVKTTSVFCISTCRARKPKKENVVFYKTYTQALKNGFRPCKICCPTENSSKTPEKIVEAIKLVKDNPKKKISDSVLRENHISPDSVRRWFKKHYGITFHGFQRMYRINNAYKELKDGKKTTDTAFQTGYESLSGFGYTFKKLVGKSPANSNAHNIILINRLTTPLGPMIVCATENGICLLEFTDRKMLETEFRDLQKLLNASILIGENPHVKQLKQEIQEYFEGKRSNFEVSLDTPGSVFQNSVWTNLRNIPFGTTSTYAEQAKGLNKLGAARAVARANGMNRVSIVIPCHRIIGANGDLKGYGGGIERKKWLIDHERNTRR